MLNWNESNAGVFIVCNPSNAARTSPADLLDLAKKESMLTADNQKSIAKLKPFLPLAEYLSLGVVRWTDRNSGYSVGFKLQYLDQFRADFGYLLPSSELMHRLADFLRDHRQVLDAGSGSGYLSQELHRLGLEDTIAIDTRDYREHLRTGYPIKQVHRLDIQADALTMAGADYVGSVLLVWPPHDFAFAEKIAMAMRPGQILLYAGEEKGGCTADDAFFDYMEGRRIWEPLTEIANSFNEVHVVMPGSTDGWLVWEKKKDEALPEEMDAQALSG